MAELQAQYLGLQIRISLDGASPRSHDYLRGNGNFYRTLNMAERLICGGVTIHGINVVLTKLNYLELGSLFSIARHLCVADLTLIDLLAIGRAKNLGSLKLGFDEWQSVFAFQASKEESADIWINVCGPFDSGLMSRFGLQHAPISFDTLYMEPDGNLIVCYPIQGNRTNNRAFVESLEHRWCLAHASMYIFGTNNCPHCPFKALCHGMTTRSS